MFYVEPKLDNSFWSKRVSAPPETYDKKGRIRLPSMLLGTDDRPQTTKGPSEKVFEEACKEPSRKTHKFTLKPVKEGYIGDPPKLKVKGLKAKLVPRMAEGNLYEFEGEITSRSDVRSSVEGVTKVEGYFNPTQPDGHVWLQTT